jgi:hypothetical protein
MRRRLAQGLAPKTVSYTFEHTSMWESAWRQCGELRFDSNGQPSVVVQESLLDELRLEGDQYKQHSLMAVKRFFAIREADRSGMTVTNECRREAELAFRRERDLVDAAQVERWMNENGLSYNEFDALMMDEARVNWVHQLAQFTSVSCLPEQLRLSGDYPRLLARAVAKNRFLESFGFKNPCLENADLTENQLLHWYFKDCLGRPVPLDPGKYSRNLGFASPQAFRRALLKDYLYRRFERQNKNAPKAQRHRAPAN